MSLPVLAKELGLDPRQALKLAQSAGVNITRYGVTVTQGQAEQIRRRHEKDRADVAERSTRHRERQARADAAREAQRSQQVDVTSPKGQEGVGVSAGGPRHQCGCCGLELPSPDVEEGSQVARRCGFCVQHFEVRGEEQARKVARLEDHELRLRQAYAQEWQRAEDTETERQRFVRSRNSWRGALVEVMGEHEETAAGCKCGAKAFPCATWRSLELANRGVTKQVEGFLAMPDEQRDEALYTRDHWDYTSDESQV